MCLETVKPEDRKSAKLENRMPVNPDTDPRGEPSGCPGSNTMATTVGVLHLKLNIVQAQSLKDKRRVVKGFKDRMRSAHNISIAEVEYLDEHRWSVLAVAMVGNDQRYVEGALQTVVNAAQRHRDMLLADWRMEWL